MILLDNNVLSEFMRPHTTRGLPAGRTARGEAHKRHQPRDRAGLLLMPPGKRQEALSQAVWAMFDEDFAGRCLAFDEDAARQYAAIVSARTRAGRPISVEDAQIAAIALAQRMPLATRNTTDFELIDGLELVNPWTGGA